MVHLISTMYVYFLIHEYNLQLIPKNMHLVHKITIFFKSLILSTRQVFLLKRKGLIMSKLSIKILLLGMLLFMSACSSELSYRNHVALSLTYQEVPLWLQKNQIDVPKYLQKDKDVYEYVLEIIENASAGKDSSFVIIENEKEFVKKIQHAAGYSFDKE